MLILYILVIGVVVGSIPTLLKLSNKTGLNISVGFVGALIGSFLAFGDAPFLMRFGISPMVTSLLGAVVFVAIAVLVKGTSRPKAG